MNTSPTELMTASLMEVFGERDRTRRLAAIERTFAPDVEFHDAEGSVTGMAALDAKAGGILDGAPADWVFEEAAPAVAINDLGRASWVFGPAGAPVVRGTDIGLIVDGRIAKLYTFLDTQ